MSGEYVKEFLTLTEAAREAAENATCTRCGALMLQAKGSGRLTTGTWRRVGEKGTEHFNLCSCCGREFRLFLAGEGDF